jgi:mannose-6-phosphate isomerase-like protein (cupin superfamily)
MAIPNGGGGYQLGDGNLNEITLGYAPAPSAYTADADVVLTVAELEGGLILYTQTGTSNFQLPLVAGVGGVDAEISSAKVGSTFDFFFISLSSGVGTITVNTGWTLVGSGATPASGIGAHFRARKTGDGTYTCYRVA